jgi:hypothetical protein
MSCRRCVGVRVGMGPGRWRPGLLLPLVAAGSVLLVGCGGRAVEGIASPASTGFTPRNGGSSVAAEVTGSVEPSGPPTSLGKPTLTDGSSISTVGLDQVHFGMTSVEAEKAAGSKLVVQGLHSDACYVAKVESGPQGVNFLVANGKVERIDVAAGPTATRSGAKVGSTVGDVRGMYAGQIENQARPDGQPGMALVFVPKDAADASFRLVFLTDGTKVQSYRAGRVPVVLAANGCG